MMQNIAMQMQTETYALMPSQPGASLRVLDICMAPGGYAATILKLNPQAEIYGITLGTETGGHQLLIPKGDLTCVLELDVTLLLEEFSDREAPASHPDYANFLQERPFRDHRFDIVFCDGMKLRQHARATYREENEAVR